MNLTLVRPSPQARGANATRGGGSDAFCANGDKLLAASNELNKQYEKKIELLEARNKELEQQVAALSGKLVTALAAALPAMLLVALTAAVSHHVHLSAAQWLALFAAMWAGVLPLALLGLAIGYLTGDDIAFPLTMALYFALGALGGLWIPPSTMPHVMQDIAKVLPSNGLAQLGWRIAGGQASISTAVVVIAAWTLASALAALLAYRRRAFRAAS